jgi:hypothetical protein
MDGTGMASLPEEEENERPQPEIQQLEKKHCNYL